MKKLSESVADYEFKHVFSDYMVAFGDKHDGVIEVICNTGNSEQIFESGYYYADSIIKPNVSISAMVGCPVSCEFCELGRAAFGRHLTPDEMYEQVILTLSQARRFTDIDGPHKVSIGKSGEPMLNPNLVSGLRRISELGVSFRVPTSFPKGKAAERIFEELVEFAREYREAVQLNISVISTSEEYRSKTTKIGADFFSIRKGIERWINAIPLEKCRKPNATLILGNNTPADPRELLDVLPPALVNICFRPYVETSNGKSSGLSLLSGEKLVELKRRFEECGYSVSLAQVSTPMEIKFKLASNSTLRRYKEQTSK